MNQLAASFAALETLCAQQLGVTVYYVADAAATSNRKPLAIPGSIPGSWVQMEVVESSLGGQAENYTGELGANADVLTGEVPPTRIFVARASLFATPPTIDGRLIVKATGQNFAIENVDPAHELSDQPMMYRLACRALN
jgi:hypothetical protein